MLFNSTEFLFVFLPITAGAWYWLNLRSRWKIAQWLLVVFSLLFYSTWTPAFIPLLIISVFLNYHVGKKLLKNAATPMLVIGIVWNLGWLIYFKYSGFFYEAATGNTLGQVAIPLGISFFTFQKIAFLVDCYKGKVEGGSLNIRSFSLFVFFFPQLVSGPIVHHSFLMPQIKGATLPNSELLGRGLALLVLGLFKKVVIADTIAGIIAPHFLPGMTLTLLESWTAIIGYTLQIYFDFSGYSEMAMGMALLFGISLPLNFNAPYQSRSVTEFWRRWHITLSTFLRDYVYIPLGGNRHGWGKSLCAVAVTMLLGGMWHGANWTFLLWGALHGVYLIIHRCWKRYGRPLPQAWGIGLTLIAVIAAWVPFRVPSIGQTMDFWTSMIGINGLYPTAHGQSLLNLVVFACLLFVCVFVRPGWQTVQEMKPCRWAFWRTAVLAIIALCMLGRPSMFLYWQF